MTTIEKVKNADPRSLQLKRATWMALLCGVILMAQVQAAPSYAAKNQAALQLYDEGLRHAFRGKIEDAISAFERAAKLDNKLADAHAYLGMLYGLRGQWKDAILAFQKAIKSRPHLCRGLY